MNVWQDIATKSRLICNVVIARREGIVSGMSSADSDCPAKLHSGEVQHKREGCTSATDEAFVTMVTNDDFVIGAEVMFHSLRQRSRARRPHVVMVLPTVSPLQRKRLDAVADEVIEVRFSEISGAAENAA